MGSFRNHSQPGNPAAIFLDPATVRAGAASRAYQFEMSGSGVLKFTFDNILLPDSTTNEPASHGFVQFRLAQRPDVPPGSVIENRAAIYFDFNQAVLTNTTWHTVGENFVLVETVTPQPHSKGVSGGARVAVFPNPFRSAATLELQGREISSGVFRLHDALGRQVRVENFSGNRLLFERRGLAAGVYFFRMKVAGEVVASGKMIARCDMIGSEA